MVEFVLSTFPDGRDLPPGVRGAVPLAQAANAIASSRPANAAKTTPWTPFPPTPIGVARCMQ